MDPVKYVSLFFAIVLVAVFVLAIFQVVNWMVFWIVAVVAFVFGYLFLPKVRKK